MLYKYSLKSQPNLKGWQPVKNPDRIKSIVPFSAGEERGRHSVCKLAFSPDASAIFWGRTQGHSCSCYVTKWTRRVCVYSKNFEKDDQTFFVGSGTDNIKGLTGPVSFHRVSWRILQVLILSRYSSIITWICTLHITLWFCIPCKRRVPSCEYILNSILVTSSLTACFN